MEPEDSLPDRNIHQQTPPAPIPSQSNPVHAYPSHCLEDTFFII